MIGSEDKNKLSLEKIYNGSFIVSPNVPISIAVKRNDIDYVKNNIQYYDFNADNGDLIKEAILHENIDMILLLVNAGTNINFPGMDYLWDSIQKRNYELVKVLIDCGINCEHTFTSTNQNDQQDQNEQANQDKIINLLVNQNIDPVVMAKVFFKRCLRKDRYYTEDMMFNY